MTPSSPDLSCSRFVATYWTDIALDSLPPRFSRLGRASLRRQLFGGLNTAGRCGFLSEMQFSSTDVDQRFPAIDLTEPELEVMLSGVYASQSDGTEWLEKLDVTREHIYRFSRFLVEAHRRLEEPAITEELPTGMITDGDDALDAVMTLAGWYLRRHLERRIQARDQTDQILKYFLQQPDGGSGLEGLVPNAADREPRVGTAHDRFALGTP